MLQNILADRYLKAGSKFSNWMKENRLADRLRNALTPADYGNLNLESLLFAPNKKQAQLLKNNTGKKRVLGVAGSGKTIILARKAAIAGSEGKKVLLVCFNITMTNYLRDITKRLARQYESDTHHQIVVRHFHRLFPKEGIQQHEFENQFDVILVDEGQDFERNWIEQLYKLGRGSFHFMLAEDDRQNIYAKKREKKRVVPEIVGRPIKLNRSFRIPSSVAKLGNALMRWSGFNSEAGPVAVDLKNSQKSVFRPKWINGSSTELLKRIQMDVDHLIHDANTGALADIAILVCNVEDGWNICEILDTLSCSYSRSFETRAENKELSAKYEHDQKRLKLKVDELRRYQKMGFWMQQGHIKVCTIHSFKGWELNRILIYFRPEKNQKTVQTPLLYTAITRAQYDTKIYCADIELSQFGTIAGSQGLVDLENLSKSPVDS